MKISTKRKFFFWIALITTSILFGCEMKEENKKVSTDVDAFNSLVTIDIPFRTVSWEVFGTPEHTAGVPGPTDFLTLIGQIELNDPKFEKRSSSGTVWIAPESARPWLEPEFRNFLESSKNSSIDLSQKGRCRTFAGILKKTSKPVDGFVCEGATKMLIYLRIANYT